MASRGQGAGGKSTALRVVGAVLFVVVCVGGGLFGGIFYDRMRAGPEAEPAPVAVDEPPPAAVEPVVEEVEAELEVAAPPEPDPALAAWVTATALNVRSGPGTDNGIVGIVVKYDPVSVVDEGTARDGTWYEIDAAGGYLSGWVSGTYLRFGEPPPGKLFQREYDYGKAETPTLVKGDIPYVGIDGCRPCHEATTGYFPKSAIEVWSTHYHAEAHDTLFRPYTKLVARDVRGVDDPTTDWRCLKCHVTALGANPEQLAPTYKESDGVGCEVCHGPGGEYAQKDHSPANENRYAMGFYKLTNLEEREKLCVKCHNTLSPSFKPFNVLAFSRALQHWPDPGERPKPPPGGKPAGPVKPIEIPETPSQETLDAYFKKAEETAVEREEVVAVEEAEETKGLSEAELAERERQEQLAREEAERAAQEALEAARIAEQERLERERQLEEELLEQARLEAEQAEAERLAYEAEQEAARAAAAAAGEPEPEPAPPPPPAGGLLGYLARMDGELILNIDGVEYGEVRFPHAAHANGKMVAGVECATCHHDLEGEERPKACSQCHYVGGTASETEAQTKASHAKGKGFPLAPGQETTSCVGCHKLQLMLIGKRAPTRCTACHASRGGDGY